MSLKRYELVGAVHKGSAVIEIPGELPLPDIFRKSEFKARRIFFGNLTRLQKETLQEAFTKSFNGETPAGWQEWKEKLKDGAEWNYFALRGKDLPRRTGLKKWVLGFICPPGYEFHEGPLRIAHLKKEPSTYRIIGAPSPHAIRTSLKTWEDYLSEVVKKKGPLDKNQLKFYKKVWKKKHRQKPHEAWYSWLPGIPSQRDLKIVDGIGFGVAAAVLGHEKAAESMAKVPILEGTVVALTAEVKKQGDLAFEDAGKMSELRLRAEAGEREIELQRRPPPQKATVQPPELTATALGKPASKPKGEPGSLNWVLFLMLFIGGIITMAAGYPDPFMTVAGFFAFIGAIVLAYWDQNYRPRKQEVKRLLEDTAESVGQGVEKAREKT